jgi:hypothetical protein
MKQDNINARRDLKRIKIREAMHVDETQPKPDLPHALYYMLLKTRRKEDMWNQPTIVTFTHGLQTI